MAAGARDDATSSGLPFVYVREVEIMQLMNNWGYSTAVSMYGLQEPTT